VYCLWELNKKEAGQIEIEFGNYGLFGYVFDDWISEPMPVEVDDVRVVFWFDN